jgi:hypothetical protein
MRSQALAISNLRSAIASFATRIAAKAVSGRLSLKENKDASDNR